MEKSKIEWTEHTGGPWFGCTKVSAGCTHCYAQALAENPARLEKAFRDAYAKAGFADWQTRPVWGDSATRVVTKGFWSDARRINARHAKAGTRGRWFPSMIDWLDLMPGGAIDQDGRPVSTATLLREFLKVVRDCTSLDFLLLTKRPQNFGIALATVDLDWCDDWTLGYPPANVWIGVSAENQKTADDRIPKLLEIPAVVRFVSAEPLLEPIALKPEWVTREMKNQHECFPRIDWMIAGGESGEGSRPMPPSAYYGLAEQCWRNDLPFFGKQWGDWAPMSEITDPQAAAMASLGRVACDQFATFRVGKKLAGATIHGRLIREYPRPRRP